MNLTSIIRRRARTQPDAIALIAANGQPISYRDFDRRIDASAAHAASLGIRPGDVVGFDLHTTTELIYGLGLARLGVVTADQRLPPHLLRLRLTADAPPDAPTDAATLQFDPAWTSLPTTGPTLGDIIAPHAAPEAICRIFASSGTTGQPKFIPLSHELQVRRVLSHWLDQAPEGGRRWILTSFGTTLGFGAAVRTWFEGGCVVRADPARAADIIPTHRVSAITASPTALADLLERLPAHAGPFPTLRGIEAGGHRISPALHHAVRTRLGGQLISHLGATEVGRIASAPLEQIHARPGAAGHLLPGVVMQSVDAQDRPLPPGEAGILRVRTNAMVQGYLGADAATGSAFRDGWFYPGDTGHIAPDGMVILGGRVSELINCGGDKIDPVILEAALCRLPQVTDAAAFGVPDAHGITRLWAAITATTTIDQSTLAACCAQALPGLRPRAILQVPRMPRNDNGKIIKALLVEYAQKIQTDPR